MGVYIPNMKMPHNCIECPRLKWYVDEDGFDRSCCQEKVLYPSTIDRSNKCPLIEIDLVRCEECEWSNGECSVGERYQGGCTFGERRE